MGIAFWPFLEISGLRATFLSNRFCFKTIKVFGCSGERGSSISRALKLFHSCNFLPDPNKRCKLWTVLHNQGLRSLDVKLINLCKCTLHDFHAVSTAQFKEGWDSKIIKWDCKIHRDLSKEKCFKIYVSEHWHGF